MFQRSSVGVPYPTGMMRKQAITSNLRDPALWLVAALGTVADVAVLDRNNRILRGVRFPQLIVEHPE